MSSKPLGHGQAALEKLLGDVMLVPGWLSRHLAYLRDLDEKAQSIADALQRLRRAYLGMVMATAQKGEFKDGTAHDAARWLTPSLDSNCETTPETETIQMILASLEKQSRSAGRHLRRKSLQPASMQTAAVSGTSEEAQLSKLLCSILKLQTVQKNLLEEKLAGNEQAVQLLKRAQLECQQDLIVQAAGAYAASAADVSEVDGEPSSKRSEDASFPPFRVVLPAPEEASVTTRTSGEGRNRSPRVTRGGGMSGVLATEGAGRNEGGQRWRWPKTRKSLKQSTDSEQLTWYSPGGEPGVSGRLKRDSGRPAGEKSRVESSSGADDTPHSSNADIATSHTLQLGTTQAQPHRGDGPTARPLPLKRGAFTTDDSAAAADALKFRPPLRSRSEEGVAQPDSRKSAVCRETTEVKGVTIPAKTAGSALVSVSSHRVQVSAASGELIGASQGEQDSHKKDTLGCQFSSHNRDVLLEKYSRRHHHHHHHHRRHHQHHHLHHRRRQQHADGAINKHLSLPNATKEAINESILRVGSQEYRPQTLEQTVASTGVDSAVTGARGLQQQNTAHITRDPSYVRRVRGAQFSERATSLAKNNTGGAEADDNRRSATRDAQKNLSEWSVAEATKAPVLSLASKSSEPLQPVPGTGDHGAPGVVVEDYVCPICCKPDWGSSTMVACDACDVWYHCDCVGFDPDANTPDAEFICHNCASRSAANNVVSKQRGDI